MTKEQMGCLVLEASTGTHGAIARALALEVVNLTAQPAAPAVVEVLYRKVRKVRAYAYRSGPTSPGTDYWYWTPSLYRPDEKPPLGWFRIDYAYDFMPAAPTPPEGPQP